VATRARPEPGRHALIARVHDRVVERNALEARRPPAGGAALVFFLKASYGFRSPHLRHFFPVATVLSSMGLILLWATPADAPTSRGHFNLSRS
jgi:hypothetical protein